MLSTAQVEAQVPARGRLDRDLQLPLPGLEDDSDSSQAATHPPPPLAGLTLTPGELGTLH